MAGLFGAEPDAHLEWRPTIWNGEPVPVVTSEAGARRLSMCPWSLPAAAFTESVAPRLRGVIYARDLAPGGGRLRPGFARCLIVIESFAYPAGEPGKRTRDWFGLRDQPLVAWAGVSMQGGCAGVLTHANALVWEASPMMPLLLPANAVDHWLDRAWLPSSGAGFEASNFYYENLGDRWSSGQTE